MQLYDMLLKSVRKRSFAVITERSDHHRAQSIVMELANHNVNRRVAGSSPAREPTFPCEIPGQISLFSSGRDPGGETR